MCLHGHSHDHDTAQSSIMLAVFGNALLMIVEAIVFQHTGSRTVEIACFHDAADCIAACFALILENQSKKWAYLSPIAALVNTAIIIASSSLVIWQALTQAANPIPLETEGLWMLAVFSFGVNAFMAIRMSSGASWNEKVIDLHFWEDAAGALALLAVCILSKFMDAKIADASLGFTIAVTLLLLALWRSAGIIRTIRNILRKIT